MAKLYLQLASGEVFTGESFGAAGEAEGELVFTTAVVGYYAAITDPCNHGQLLVQTFPLAGNYGIIPDDALADAPQVGALIVREVCAAPSNYRCAGRLEDYMKAHALVGMCGVDTRALTALLRKHGTLNARITQTPPAGAPDAALRHKKIDGEVAAVSVRTPVLYPAAGETKHRVAMLDFGAGQKLIDALTRRGCAVTLYPPHTAAADLLAGQPDGLVLTPGPGDPCDNPAPIATLRTLWGKLPMMGLGLGHQLLALAAGAKTYKLHAGHRGSNQPVKRLCDGRVYITTQNHGYAVDAATLPAEAKQTLLNVNDGSCEGIDYPAARAFGVQHDPLASDGAVGIPVIDRFISMLEEVANHAL